MTTVPLAPVRRWISSRQSAHRDYKATAGTVYFTLLWVTVVGGMVHEQLAAAFWPTHPNVSALAGAALTPILFGVLYQALRRFGPLALSRPAASWLLPAPVSRRRLLLPSLRLTALVAASLGALAGLAIVGHAAPRTLGGESVALLVVDAGLAGVGLMLVALAAQAGGRWGERMDQLIALLLAGGVVALVYDATTAGAPATGGWPSATTLLPLVGAVALSVGFFFTLAVRGLARTPNERILEAARTAGTLFDSAFGMEPSFLTDMIARRYWARRRLRSTRLPARLPVLVAQDLVLTARRRTRLLWLALAASVPVLLGAAPPWLLALAVLAGALLAGTTPGANVQTDAGNPVLLRLLGLSSRSAILQRMVVPGVLAGVWSALALALLDVLDLVPPGPWWALGLALGPVGAVAAVRRARVGFVRNELLPLDTPMGTLSTGPLVNALVGPDALLLGLPALVDIAQHQPLSWTAVGVQAAVGLFGARAYLAGSTDKDRVELSR
jgi:Family of unknown function (DUF6297)